MEEINHSKSIPWERRRYLGFFRALGKTINEVFVHPKRFFGRLAGIDSCLNAFLFYLVMSLFIGSIVGIILLLSNLSSLKIIFPYSSILIVALVVVFILICIIIFERRCRHVFAAIC